jgi:hypothetical protein
MEGKNKSNGKMQKAKGKSEGQTTRRDGTKGQKSAGESCGRL